MLSVYKREEKTMDNPSSFRNLKGVEEMTKPFLLCLIQDNTDNNLDIYKLMKVATQLSRIYSMEDAAARFKINEFPLDILGIKYEKQNEFSDQAQEITEEILYPLLTQKQTYMERAKQARKINILTFGDGVLTYKRIESRLIDKLLLDGLSEMEIKNILSQICIVSINTKQDTSSLKTKSIVFNDVLDLRILISDTKSFIEQLSKRKYLFGPFEGTKNLLCIYKGSGFHKVEDCLKKNCVIKPALSSVITYLIENSIENTKTDKFIPIYTKDILQRMIEYTSEEKTTDELLKKLDDSLVYGNSPKYTQLEESKKIRDNLNISYMELNRLKENIRNISIDKPKQKTKDDDKK